MPCEFPLCNWAQLLSVFAAIFGVVGLVGGLVMAESQNPEEREQSKTYVQAGIGLLGIAATLFIAGGGASG